MNEKTRILRLVNSIESTSNPYNELTLPMLDTHDVTICAFFQSDLVADKRIKYYAGDGRVVGFVRLLKDILRSETFDVIDAHSPHVGVMFLLAVMFGRPRAIKQSVMRVHNCFECFKLRNKLLFLPCFAFFSRLSCCSHASLSSWPWIYRRLAGRRLGAIPNGVDIRRIGRVREQRPPAEDRRSEFRILSVAAAIRIKNHSTTLQAFARCKSSNALLTIVGRGELEEQLKHEAQDLGIGDRVRFTGRISREETLAYMLSSDLYISVSHGEGLPLSVLEAMACNCPVVASDIGPHREVDDRSGCVRFVGCDDVDALAGEIDRVVEMQLADRTAWGAKCRRHVEHNFSLEQQLLSYARLFDEIVTATG